MTDAERPKVLCRTHEVIGSTAPEAAGALWKLSSAERDLDANLVQLPPRGRVDGHHGAEVDVLLHVVGGSGTLTTEADVCELVPGAVLWLPKGSWRAFEAGDGGLQYLSVHRRREPFVLGPTVTL